MRRSAPPTHREHALPVSRRGFIGVALAASTTLPSRGARAAYPERVYLAIYRGERPDDAFDRHWCFKARWRTQVDAFWDAGIAAGGSDDGPPGLRKYHASYYAAFLRDPDGNRIEAVCHQPV